METRITVRQATRQDIAAIVELWKELMIYHAEKDSLFTLAPDAEEVYARFVEDNIDSEAACVLAAVVNGRLVGYCQGKLEKYPPVLAEQDYGHIFDIAVTADQRRTGVGKRMVAALHDWSRRKEVSRIEVRCLRSNDIGSRFWREIGFEPYLETLFKRC